MPTKCCWVINSRLTSERKDSTSPSSFINHSTLPLEHSSAKLLVFTCTGALNRLRTHRRVGFTRRRGNHRHDHSQFQRDIDWRHRRLSLSLSLSLYYSQKSLTHNIRSASALPIIEASQSYSTFCDTRLHAYLWHVMTLITVFSTLRLHTLCTFSHEPPHLALMASNKFLIDHLLIARPRLGTLHTSVEFSFSGEDHHIKGLLLSVFVQCNDHVSYIQVTSPWGWWTLNATITHFTSSRPRPHVQPITFFELLLDVVVISGNRLQLVKCRLNLLSAFTIKR